ncbi:hypothetical protein ABXJ76_13845 [Methylobacter sp. G7]|uniref:type IV pilus modification PilV family protein n=1 Tax=Methylobacter sp. G7 TaxID=3230117 RepID=UPI003D800C9E
MKSVFQKKRNHGIGLIEVLITTVVVALGLLSVASMQGGLMFGSATNKTRAEAIVLAEQKMEELRNYMTRTQLEGHENANDTITGVNATFNRDWQITANGALTTTTQTPRIGLIVKVSWGNAADQQVAVNSEIGYVEPSNTAGLASGSGEASHRTGPGIASPHPNVRSSIRTPNIVDLFNPDTTIKPGFTLVEGSTNLYVDEEGNVYRHDGGGALTGRQIESIVNLNKFDVDLRFQVSNDDDPDNDIYLYTKRDSTNPEKIYLYTANIVGGIGDGKNKFDAVDPEEPELDGTASIVRTYLGGVILSIKGNVYTVNNLDDIKIDHNREDMYCVFNPGEGQSERKYACYPGGSCKFGPAGNNAADQCSSPAIADISVGPGGWRGNVGLINVDDAGGGKESVCYLEEVNNQESERSTARKYKGMLSSHEQGVNQSYSCQDYLIVGRRNNFSQLAAACAVAVGNLSVTSLPPKEVVRTISGSNTVAGIDSTFCNNLSAKDYTLTIAASTATDVTVEGGTATVTCSREIDTDNFTCSGQTKSNVLSVIAVAPAASGNCTVELNTSSQPATGSCSITLVTPPIYTLDGTITGNKGHTPTVTVTNDFGITNTCTASSSTFSCVIQTNYTTVRILGTKIGNKTPYCTVSDLNLQPGESGTRDNVCELKY